jgi:hypothetical protein
MLDWDMTGALPAIVSARPRWSVDVGAFVRLMRVLGRRVRDGVASGIAISSAAGAQRRANANADQLARADVAQHRATSNQRGRACIAGEPEA